MHKLKDLYNKLPKNTFIRVVAVSATVGATFYLLPFVLAGIVGWWAYSAIHATGPRYAAVGAAAVFAFVFGIPWTASLVSPSQTTQPPTSSVTEAALEEAETPVTSPVIEKQTTTETEEIPYEKSTINDSSMDKGKTTLKTQGQNGIKTLTYEITLTDGTQTEKKLVKEETTKEPITELTALGTKVAVTPTPKANAAPAPTPSVATSEPASEPVVSTPNTSNCDPNYSGGCVPIDSDVDCAGGSGNGPSYVKGPVQVTGRDIYGLDRDDDGVGCE